MYSIVLATLLTAGAGSTTSWCHGCRGCTGYSACHGYSTCQGVSYCTGCMGCWGGGYAVSSSCYCSGGFGCTGYYGCSGCHGCCGGVVVYAPRVVYSSCSGCSGCCGGGMIYSAPITAPTKPAVVVPTTKLTPPNQETTTAGQTARITVKLPDAAKLWVDNVYCPLASNERTFKTPALQPGQQYFYTLRVEVEKDGRLETENRRVNIAAGLQVNVDFNTPATVTAQR